MQNIKWIINGVYSPRGIVGISVLAAIIFPIIIFVFFHPYYDRSENPFYPLGYGLKTVLNEDIELIKQPIFSNTKNLAKITIEARNFKKNIAKLSLIDRESKIMRSTAKPRITNNQIVWEFAPIDGSSEQMYYLIIEIFNRTEKNIRLTLIPTGHQDQAVAINRKVIEKKSLIFYTESKFTSPKEKMQTFYKRMITNKPIIIVYLFSPVLLIFFILLIIGLRIIISKIIIPNNQ